MRPFCLEVTGDHACFTRPEMKVERVSYDVITPSAARAIFEAIFWKPGVRWRMRRIDILKPVRWISVRRNEVGAVASTRNAITAMHAGHGQLALYIEDERQQRAGLFLREVGYRLYADMELLTSETKALANKYVSMFNRRACNGQCVNQPYLGCREFAARFRLVDLVEEGTDYRPQPSEPAPLTDMTTDLGWMFYDLDFADTAIPKPQFFRAKVVSGVIDLLSAEVRG